MVVIGVVVLVYVVVVVVIPVIDTRNIPLKFGWYQVINRWDVVDVVVVVVCVCVFVVVVVLLLLLLLILETYLLRLVKIGPIIMELMLALIICVEGGMVCIKTFQLGDGTGMIKQFDVDYNRNQPC